MLIIELLVDTTVGEEGIVCWRAAGVCLVRIHSGPKCIVVVVILLAAAVGGIAEGVLARGAESIRWV